MSRAILLVDDERDSLEPMRVLLEEEFSILTAESGAEALKLLEHELVDMIISDQRMPVMTGVELLTRVRELYPDIVRVILTGYTDTDAMIKAMNEGRVYRYLAKPWSVDDMRMVIRQGLEWKDLINVKGRLNADLAEAHQSLAERTKELEQAHETVVSHEKLAAVGRFASEMVHEMNNYLQGILSVSESVAIAMESQLSELKELESHTKILGEIASDIRDFSLGAALPFNPALIDPLGPIRDMLRLCTHHPSFKGVALSLDHGEIPHWRMDTRQLKHLLLNLLKNAAKASEHKGKVTVDIQVDSEKLILKVIDQGKGIPEDKRAHIFDPFFTTSDDEGTGLGLSICKQVADMHNGDLLCDETPGGGATFTFQIPVLPDQT
ncbi:MAG: hybrid sensor histidine kinase/response regulator [Proteobacteria bacterium]|nr:hybrid sensor histidine kinase/response regulator [Pseudomonadota bacterium]